jgi:predicted ester cyclase
MTLQAAKDLIRRFEDALDDADDPATVLRAHLAPGWQVRAVHPFGVLSQAEAAERVWRPLKASFSALRRRRDIFFAGLNEIDGFTGTWVVSMGHLCGLFDAPWLGIPPTGRMAFLRLVEFHRVEGDRITESAFFCDIPHLMMQAGLTPFPTGRGAHLVQPGPDGHGGLLFGAQPPHEGVETLALINRMITDLGTWKGSLPLTDELARTWDPRMIWWGPAGIGATMTIDRYAQQHSGPFRAAFADRTGTGHLARLAEGHFGGFFGWPNFRARHRGGFLNLAVSDQALEFRVVDIYRRSTGTLAENWVFIDLLHVLHQQGRDLLSELTCS